VYISLIVMYYVYRENRFICSMHFYFILLWLEDLTLVIIMAVEKSNNIFY